MHASEGVPYVFRLLLVIIVLVVGYDAIVHQGAYTRDAWNSIVRLTQSSVEGAKDLGERARN
ncbi:putative protein OS=Bosea thiooxidans OX=53254 GN=SAMN05660750_00118 PE=4 SV=1 [Bosea thiooxidans]|uniref:Uncharacterized protein n=1 Tax=Bosea thiooxidans TaxID=53254 RepID=A0A1T5AEQ9_9HYPH|nr:hypothetical protein SAMN05660750_00118 [Bosea thiooxidans]